MKITFIVFGTMALFSVFLGCQSLNNNEYYREMTKLKQQSEAAFKKGDYPEAQRIAAEVQNYKELFDQWMDAQLAEDSARIALANLKDRLADASKLDAAEKFPERYAQGTAFYEQAFEAFHEDMDYMASFAASSKGLEVLTLALFELPAFYQVRYLPPERRDSLWNIAAYDFVYGDSRKWTMLYEANRGNMPQGANPDYILPGMILIIPPLPGETRWGTWVNGEVK